MVTTKEEIDVKYNFRPFKDAPTTRQKVDNVLELDSIDLSEFKEGPKGLEKRKELADQLESSLTKYGFFKLVGHGIKEETFDTLKSIAQSAFELPENEKGKYLAGSYPIEQEKDRKIGVIPGSGFKPKGYWKFVKGIPDNIEFLNFRHFLHDEIFKSTPYPEFVQFHLDDIQAYYKYLHLQVLKKVLNLIDLILEIPEGTLYENYFKKVPGDIFKSGGGFARLIWYYPSTDDYNSKTDNTWMRGHADGSALTFIASQSILSLQIQDYETKKYRYVTHTPNALVVNIGDAFQHLTGGYFRSSIHRVATAPEDQRQYNRTTAIYFCHPRSEMYIDPETVNSPKLNRLGYKLKPGEQKVTFGDWDKAKSGFFNQQDAYEWRGVELYGRESLASIVDKISSSDQENAPSVKVN